MLRVLGSDLKVAELTLARINKYVDQRLTELAKTIDGNEVPAGKPQRHTIQHEIRTLLQALGLAKADGLYLGEPSKLRPEAFKKQARFYTPGTGWLSNAEQCQTLIDHTSDSERVNIDRKLHIVAYIHLGARRDELELMHSTPKHGGSTRRSPLASRSTICAAPSARSWRRLACRCITAPNCSDTSRSTW